MATNPSTLQDVFERNQYDLATAAKKSRAWFDQQVLLMNRQQITPPKVLKGDPSALKTNVMPGKLYMFMYDPKLKATLPYYDKFPLVFPFRKVEGGFLGLNMHYLPYQLRVRLLDRLMAFKSNQKMDETTRLKYSWGLIDGVSRYNGAIPCVKHYLSDHVRSPFRQIPADDWATAMLLPVERFTGATKEQVWLDSKRKMR
jgi:hypothetical protein